MKDRKGFTLVELLAVIVILAIIMIIAIPSVLGTLETARRKTFVEYAVKVHTALQKSYLQDMTLGTLNIPSDATGIIYTLDDLGFSSTGDYYGFIMVSYADRNCLSFNSMSYKDKTCEGVFITMYLMNAGTNYTLAFIGKLDGKFPSEVEDYPFYNSLEEYNEHYAVQGTNDDYYIMNLLMMDRENLELGIKSIIESLNSGRDVFGYNYYNYSDLKK